MKSFTVTITPELARKYLDRNIEHNRPVRKSLVNHYAEQMKRGEWKITPQGISFDTKGRLIDGQHRLLAVVESGCSVPMYVTKDVPEDRMMILDCGAKRIYADILKIADPKFDVLYNRNTCAIAKELLRLFYGVNKPSVAQVGDYIKDRRGFFMLCNYLKSRCNNYNSSTPCIIGCAAAHMNGVPLEQIEDFLRVVGYNDVDVDGYNNRAALDYKDYLLSSRKGMNGYGASTKVRIVVNSEKRPATEVAIFKFVNNRKTCRQEEPYPITDEMLKAFIWNKH